jgi:microcystin-dependent protein
MASPFVGEVRPWACNFAPLGWAFCAGQLLAIQQNTALFSLLGTYYGGDGVRTFALPDLQSRAPICYGTNPNGTYAIGEVGGTETVTLSGQQMPVHTHTFSGTNATATSVKPSNGAALGTSSPGGAYYAASTSTLTTINVGTVSLYAGGNQAHSNIQPYQAINWCIALQGIYPPRT